MSASSTEIRVFSPEHRDAQFWTLMGPAFASPTVRSALPTLADRGDYWFVVENGGVVSGFGALHLDGDRATLRHAWVAPNERDSGLGSMVLDARIAQARELGATTLLAVVHRDWLASFEARGFVRGRQNGAYTHVSLSLEPAAEIEA